MSLSLEIKDYARSLGYDYVGITSAEGFPGYLRDLQERREMYRFAVEGPLKLLEAAEPRNYLPGAGSIIVAAYDYSKDPYPENLPDMIGRYYLGRCQPSKRHNTDSHLRQRTMKEFLVGRGMRVVENAVLPERLLAARAGIARFGKNNFVYGGDSGSFISITSFIVDTVLEYDHPAAGEVCPGGCTLCLDACPTGALYEPYRLDPRRCIALYTFSGSVLFPDLSHPLPPAEREKMGTRIFGCDTCQEACPLNREKLKPRLASGPLSPEADEDLNLSRIINMDDEYFQKNLSKFTYSYSNKKQHIQRNAAIALGNRADPEAVPALAEALKDQGEVVRAYAAWALGQIGGSEARRVLEEALDGEGSELVIREIRDARMRLLKKQRSDELCRMIL